MRTSLPDNRKRRSIHRRRRNLLLWPGCCVCLFPSPQPSLSNRLPSTSLPMLSLDDIILSTTQSTTSSALRAPVSSSLPPLQFDFPLDPQLIAETEAMANEGWSPNSTGPSTPMSNTRAPLTVSTATKRARDSNAAFDRHAKRVQLAEHVPLLKSYSQVCTCL
jgi:hypothetical protein